MLRIAALPETVRIIPDDCYEWHEVEEGEGKEKRVVSKRGDPLPDAAVFVCRPLKMLEAARAASRGRAGGAAAYAEVCAEQLVAIESLDGAPAMVGDVPFSAKDPAHVDALDFVWCMQVGQKLLERTELSEEDAGKSS